VREQKFLPRIEIKKLHLESKVKLYNVEKCMMPNFYRGGPVLKVQVFVVCGLCLTSRCHLPILLLRVEEK
jgi:hypothetical protein